MFPSTALFWIFFIAPTFAFPTAPQAANRVPLTSGLHLNQISFIPNQGQMNPEVAYYHQGSRNHIFFTTSKIAMLATGKDGTRAVEIAPEKMGEQCRIAGTDPLPGRVSYLKGAPSRWKQNLPTYGGVVYREAWPGIDIKFYASGSALEYDCILAPGANPASIRFTVSGKDRLDIGPDGELIVSANGRTLVVQKKPAAYQEIDGVRRDVPARYVVSGSTYGLAVADYDPKHQLVIDPLVFSMLVGGTVGDEFTDLAVDAQGYIYAVGSSSSTDYPVLTAMPGGAANSGGYDCVITRFTPDGSAIDRSTYLGGDKEDGGNCIAVRSDGEVIVAGNSMGGTFPVSSTGVFDNTHGGNNKADIFVARLPYDLSSLRWATYVGGGQNEFAKDMALDGGDNIHIIGYTSSFGAQPFPTTAGAYQTALNGWQDAVVFRLKNDGTALDFSTYIGGSDGDPDAYFGDYGQAIAVTGDGVYIAGTAYGADFPSEGFILTPPSLGGVSDAFYGRLSLTGTPQLLTLLGGGSRDVLYGLAMAPREDYFVLTGYTWSTDFPGLNGYDTSHNGGTDVFVAGIEISSFTIGGKIFYQRKVKFASLVGGSGNDIGQSITIDGGGSIYVGGQTGSTDFPVKNAADNTFNGGTYDLFVTRLPADASSLLWSTYLGGSDSDFISALALDSSGGVIGAGYTYSDDFPVVNYPENMGVNKGDRDALLFKLTPQNPIPPGVNLLLLLDD